MPRSSIPRSAPRPHPLSVDDLKEGRGSEYVDRSQVILIFLSLGYFKSTK